MVICFFFFFEALQDLFYFSSSLYVLTCEKFEGSSLNIILLD